MPADGADPSVHLQPARPAADRKIRVFRDATAIVTGGASGIGRALAEELALRGSRVVLVDRQSVLADEVADGIRRHGGRATAVAADVTDFDALRRIVAQTAQSAGRIDYMFNNAGFNIFGKVAQYTIEDWRQLLDTNLMGVVNGVQAVFGLMINQGFGHIVNTASMAGLIPFPFGMVAYSASKHAVVGLSRSLRAEAASLGIRVSVLCPGFVQTAIMKEGGAYGKILYELSPEQARWTEKMIKRCKPVSPEWFARKALDRVARNQSVIIVPALSRWFWRIHRIVPEINLFLAQRQYEKGEKLRPPESKFERIPYHGHDVRESLNR